MEYIKTFELWKAWTLKHLVTPVASAKDIEEKQIARNIKHAIKRMNLDFNKYKEYIEEYENMLIKYSRKRKYLKKEERFLIWKAWVTEHKRLPCINSEDKYEKYLAYDINNCMVRMRTNPEKYSSQINEYKKFQYLFSTLKSVEEIFRDWKSFVLANHRLPSNINGVYEKRIYERMIKALKLIKKDDSYKDILDEYIMLRENFGKRKIYKTFEEHFETWKTWTIEHKIVPSAVAEDNDERLIAMNMAKAKCAMKKDLSKYFKIIEEQEKIYKIYKRKGRKKNEK